jgi:hypothetical protein
VPQPKALPVVRTPVVAAFAVVLLAVAIGLNAVRPHERGPAAGALSPVQGMPVYLEGFPAQVGRSHAG